MAATVTSHASASAVRPHDVAELSKVVAAVYDVAGDEPDCDGVGVDHDGDSAAHSFRDELLELLHECARWRDARYDLIQQRLRSTRCDERLAQLTSGFSTKVLQHPSCWPAFQPINGATDRLPPIQSIRRAYREREAANTECSRLLVGQLRRRQDDPIIRLRFPQHQRTFPSIAIFAAPLASI
jgi:hypothetical protein